MEKGMRTSSQRHTSDRHNTHRLSVTHWQRQWKRWNRGHNDGQEECTSLFSSHMFVCQARYRFFASCSNTLLYWFLHTVLVRRGRKGGAGFDEARNSYSCLVHRTESVPGYSGSCCVFVPVNRACYDHVVLSLTHSKQQDREQGCCSRRQIEHSSRETAASSRASDRMILKAGTRRSSRVIENR
jgi:hypothetical protein